MKFPIYPFSRQYGLKGNYVKTHQKNELLYIFGCAAALASSGASSMHRWLMAWWFHNMSKENHWDLYIGDNNYDFDLKPPPPTTKMSAPGQFISSVITISTI
jgi:hypothetical protein